MPRDILLHGVIIPALAALGLFVVLELIPMRGRTGNWLRARAPLLAVAVAFALSFRARQGWSWPIASRWEWIAPALMAVTLVALVMPQTTTPGRRWFEGVVMSILAGAIMAWAMQLPGHDSTEWRAGIGAAVAALTLVFVGAGSLPLATLAGAGASFGGLSLIILGSGFEKLSTITACTAATLVAISLLSAGERRVRREPRHQPRANEDVRTGAGLAAQLALIVVGSVAVGASYGHDSFPSWPWMAALLAVASMLPALLARTERARAVLVVLLPAFIACGAAAAVLIPLIQRGEFPPH